MQKLRPYVLPGLFVFHLVVLCVMLAIVSPRNNTGKTTTLQQVQIGVFVLTLYSQYFLTALLAGLGSGPWVLRIPSWGALAVLDHFSLIYFVRADWPPWTNEGLLLLFLGPFLAWSVTVAMLLLLRVTPFLKWRVALQPTSPDHQSNQRRRNSLTHGILIVVTTWGGVLMLLKDSCRWPELATVANLEVLLPFSGVAAIVGAGTLVLTVLAVSLTLTRFADWMFYRRRWTLPLLVTLGMGAAIMLLLSLGGPFKDGSNRLFSVLWVLVGLATQPVATLLVMGMAGCRLAPRKPPEPHSSEPAPKTPQTITGELTENWLPRLQRVHFAAPVAVLVFLGWIGVTGLWNDHFIRTSLGRITKNDRGEIRYLAVKSSVATAELMHLKRLNNLEDLNFAGTEVTDAGLVHIKGMTKLQSLNLDRTKITDAGLAHLKEMNNLQKLSLDFTKVTDAGLVHLKGLAELRELNLLYTQITDSGLMHLGGMTELHDLTLGGSQNQRGFRNGRAESK